MKTDTVKLKNRRWIATQTAAFVLERPSSYAFKAGQFADVEVGEMTHTFTIASAPHESDLLFATRMRDSAFKNALDGLRPGDHLEIGPAAGEFTLGTEVGPVVFIAGGIGVTPARSIVLDAAHNNFDRRLWFFYANRRTEDAAFLVELRNVEDNYENFTMIPTMTRADTSKMSWDGETGRIDVPMIRKHVPQLDLARYYICGPPGMVNAAVSMLTSASVGEERIHLEQFAGY